MPERDADKKAAMPEHTRRVGGGTAESRGGAHQAGPAWEGTVGGRRFVTMEEVVCRENMLAAYDRVVGNKGAPGVDGMSPLLSNVLLDELDKELERRGHRFVRYADDCNIYVRSRHAG